MVEWIIFQRHVRLIHFRLILVAPSSQFSNIRHRFAPTVSAPSSLMFSSIVSHNLGQTYWRRVQNALRFMEHMANQRHGNLCLQLTFPKKTKNHCLWNCNNIPDVRRHIQSWYPGNCIESRHSLRNLDHPEVINKNYYTATSLGKVLCGNLCHEKTKLLMVSTPRAVNHSRCLSVNHRFWISGTQGIVLNAFTITQFCSLWTKQELHHFIRKGFLWQSLPRKNKTTDEFNAKSNILNWPAWYSQLDS